MSGRREKNLRRSEGISIRARKAEQAFAAMVAERMIQIAAEQKRRKRLRHMAGAGVLALVLGIFFLWLAGGQ